MAAPARTELDRGLGRFAVHDYAGAIAAFDAGYAIDPHPDFLYAKAQAQRLGGDCSGAIASYNAFLASNPPQREGDLAKSNISKCEQLLAPVADHVETTPEPIKPEPIAPVQREGKRIEVVPPAEDTPWWNDGLGIGMATTGLLSIGVSAGFALEARSNADDTAKSHSLLDWKGSRDAWERDTLFAEISAGVGAALVIAAAVRFSIAGHHGHDRVTATIRSTPHSSAILLEGRW
jgi:hypothetical protein